MIFLPSLSFLSEHVVDKESSKSERKRRESIKSIKAQRGVRFLPVVYVREILSVKNYTEDEKRNTWYSKEENLKRKADLSMESTNKDGKHCFRGLEGRSREGLRKRRLNRLCAWMSVFEEQERQRDLGIHTPMAIAIVYSFSVQKCCIEAYKTALLDELETWNFE
jgi:hypothetical protein